MLNQLLEKETFLETAKAEQVKQEEPVWNNDKPQGVLEENLGAAETIANLYPAVKTKYEALEATQQKEMYEKLSELDRGLADVFIKEEH